MSLRSVCRVIGYVDLVLSILALLVLLGASILLGWSSLSKDEKINAPETSDPSHATDSTHNDIFIEQVIFLFTGLFLLGVFIIYYSVVLIKGTKKGVLPRDGLTNCLKWRRLNFSFIGLTLSSMLRGITLRGHDKMTLMYVPYLSVLGVQVVAMLIVHKHIKQLEMEVHPIAEDI